MYYEVLSDDRRAVLPKFRVFKDQFYLAGGTALALQIGHRDSADFDFFRHDSFEISKILEVAQQEFGDDLIVTQQEKDTLTLAVCSIKISFLGYPYPLIENLIEVENINLATVLDIGCMKLSTILGRASIKDYADLYFILRRIPLKELLEAAKKKYPALDTMVILKSLIYFDDIEFEPLIYKIDNPPTFELIKQFLVEETRQYLS